jgi:CBS domain-containing protein
MATVRDVMSTDLVSVSPTATVAEAATVMGTRRVGSALVMDAHVLLGIFTERDILRSLAADFDAPSHQVSESMTRSPRTIDASMDIGEALDTMLEQGFRHFPVTDGDRVIGIVSMRDLTKGTR